MFFKNNLGGIKKWKTTVKIILTTITLAITTQVTTTQVTTTQVTTQLEMLKIPRILKTLRILRTLRIQQETIHPMILEILHQIIQVEMHQVTTTIIITDNE